MKLIGYYNEYGYRIKEVGGETLYEAGNSPYESSSVVSLDKAISLSQVELFCQWTGQDMANEIEGEWMGAEYEVLEDCDCCGGEHPANFTGDCRDNENRFPKN